MLRGGFNLLMLSVLLVVGCLARRDYFSPGKYGVNLVPAMGRSDSASSSVHGSQRVALLFLHWTVAARLTTQVMALIRSL